MNEWLNEWVNEWIDQWMTSEEHHQFLPKGPSFEHCFTEYRALNTHTSGVTSDPNHVQLHTWESFPTCVTGHRGGVSWTPCTSSITQFMMIIKAIMQLLYSQSSLNARFERTASNLQKCRQYYTFLCCFPKLVYKGMGISHIHAVLLLNTFLIPFTQPPAPLHPSP